MDIHKNSEGAIDAVFFIGKFYDLPYDIKNAPRAVHRCIRKSFDYVKSHLVRKAVKPLLRL